MEHGHLVTGGTKQTRDVRADETSRADEQEIQGYSRRCYFSPSGANKHSRCGPARHTAGAASRAFYYHGQMHSSDTDGDKRGRAGFVVGEWTVAPSRNLLMRGDEQVRVEPRVMDVLVHLAQQADQPVSKEELIERVWNGRYVGDDVLTVTIYGLRKALGDDARRPRYIETVSRRGYRLIAPVGTLTRASAQIQAEAPTQPEAARPRRYSWAAFAATVALAMVAAGAVWMLTAARHRRHVPPAEAHEAYLKGRYFLDQRSILAWQQALEQFESAVAVDAQDPAAQAGLADTYTAMSDFGVASPAEMRPRASKAAQRALELDAQSAEAHAALG